MKQLITILLALFTTSNFATTATHFKPLNTNAKIVVITLDGFRWQEVFNGADSAILFNEKYTKNVPLTAQLFWDADTNLRRKKLLPFFLDYISSNGQLYGNRIYGAKSNVANIHKISTPGYYEMFTGKVEHSIWSNEKVVHTQENIFSQLSHTFNCHDQVALFGSWNHFATIFNSTENKLPIGCKGENTLALESYPDTWKLAHSLEREASAPSEHIRLDELTFLEANEYIFKKYPKVVFIGAGETDEYAHLQQYDKYLLNAKRIDQLISELWYTLQCDSFYKHNTTLIITTDHGRGKNANTWYKHNMLIPGSGETWHALLGPQIQATGEVKLACQFWQKDIYGLIWNNLSTPNSFVNHRSQ